MTLAASGASPASIARSATGSTSWPAASRWNPTVSQPQSPLQSEPPSGWLGFAKGLTLANSLAILVLLLGLVPAYFVYRLVSDPALIDRFFSSYDVQSTATACRIV